MTDREKTCVRRDLEQMSTQQLDAWLQAELRKDRPDAQVVLPILDVLEQREKDDPIAITPQMVQAWEDFCQKTSVPQKASRKRGWIAAVAAVAVAACLVVAMIPRTVGAESFLDVFFRWTESVFEFFTTEQDATNPPVDYVFTTDNPGLQQLYDTVTLLGVTDPVVPMWLPDGYVLSDLSVTTLPDGNKVAAKFECNGNTVVLTYRISYESKPIKYEKTDVNVEACELSGITHLIIENEKDISVTWSTDGVECSISATLEKEAIYQVIKSIYKRELL